MLRLLIQEACRDLWSAARAGLRAARDDWQHSKAARAEAEEHYRAEEEWEASRPKPSEVADARRERLEDERNRLENSFGWGPLTDAQVRDRIVEIDRMLSGPDPRKG